MPLSKPCQTCGREIVWRRKWADCWDEVRHCSTACRRNKPGRTDTRLEQAILELLEARATRATICPSEAARAVFPDEAWRTEMERTRRAARRLVAQGRIEIVQKGRMVDPSRAKGPIRLRLKS
ncbi:MAG: DUF2256 and DUF3253 domain-containing protein [Verrucomicrobiota bacterium]